MNNAKLISGITLTTLGITTSIFQITGNATLQANPLSISLLSTTAFIVGIFLLRAGLEQRILITSQVKNNPSLLRLAKKMPEETGREINYLIQQLKNGNYNPGIGTKPINKNISELRGRNGARIYYEKQNKNHYSILGYSDKKTQKKAINYIQKEYHT